MMKWIRLPIVLLALFFLLNASPKPELCTLNTVQILSAVGSGSFKHLNKEKLKALTDAIQDRGITLFDTFIEADDGVFFKEAKYPNVTFFIVTTRVGENCYLYKYVLKDSVLGISEEL